MSWIVPGPFPLVPTPALNPLTWGCRSRLLPHALGRLFRAADVLEVQFEEALPEVHQMSVRIDYAREHSRTLGVDGGGCVAEALSRFGCRAHPGYSALANRDRFGPRLSMIHRDDVRIEEQE